MRDFWGKRWNQFVAHTTREMVFGPAMRATQSRQMGVMAVFVVLALVHAYPMWMDGLHSSAVLVAFGFFILQPLCMVVEQKLILPRVWGSERVNAVVHSGLTFVLLAWAFVLSLLATCSATQ